MLIPIFEEQTRLPRENSSSWYRKALEMASLGETDVLLVHAPAAKRKKTAGDVINQQLVMHNDFIIVGRKRTAN